jgi:hypothetical protein
MNQTSCPAMSSVPSPDTLARSAQRAHYLDLIQIYTGLGDEEIDLILMHLPRTKEPAAQDDRNANPNAN